MIWWLVCVGHSPLDVFFSLTFPGRFLAGLFPLPSHFCDTRTFFPFIVLMHVDRMLHCCDAGNMSTARKWLTAADWLNGTYTALCYISHMYRVNSCNISAMMTAPCALSWLLLLLLYVMLSCCWVYLVWLVNWSRILLHCADVGCRIEAVFELYCASSVQYRILCLPVLVAESYEKIVYTRQAVQNSLVFSWRPKARTEIGNEFHAVGSNTEKLHGPYHVSPEHRILRSRHERGIPI